MITHLNQAETNRWWVQFIWAQKLSREHFGQMRQKQIAFEAKAALLKALPFGLPTKFLAAQHAHAANMRLMFREAHGPFEGDWGYPGGQR